MIYVLSWLTPTILFFILNLMIITILITSTFRNNNNNNNSDKKQREGESPLPRTPSLLQRVRSVNLSFPDPFNSPLTTHHHTNSSPSLFQRIRSINSSSRNPTPFPSLDEQPAAHTNDPDEEDLKCHVTKVIVHLNIHKSK
ncbi:hypothetical protein P3L10_026876 [Capsicum annuum]